MSSNFYEYDDVTEVKGRVCLISAYFMPDQLDFDSRFDFDPHNPNVEALQSLYVEREIRGRVKEVKETSPFYKEVYRRLLAGELSLTYLGGSNSGGDSWGPDGVRSNPTVEEYRRQERSSG